MDLERVLCMTLAQAQYDPRCCIRAIELCKAYKAKFRLCCAGVEPGCAGWKENGNFTTFFGNMDHYSMSRPSAMNHGTDLVGTDDSSTV